MERTTTIIPQADVERQLGYCEQIAALTAQWGEQPLAFVDTYGCQQNEADSERIRGYLERMGLPRTRRGPASSSSTPAPSGSTLSSGCWAT